jgi:transmembrane sensor
MDWPAQAGAVDDVLCALDERLRQRRAVRRRAFAGVLGVMLVVGGVAQFSRTSSLEPASAPPAIAAVAARVSLPERQVLADGSIVELRPGARISVEFTDVLRRVVLEAGEAHFQVEKNAARPFVVAAHGVEFWAVGTAFNVQLDSRSVELVVTEGRVAIDRGGATVPPTALAPAIATGVASGGEDMRLTVVDAGQRVVVEAATEKAGADFETESLPPSALAERMAWRVPRLELSGTPLVEAIRLINQHSQVKLSLGDPSLASVRLSGVLRADNVDTLLSLLAESHGIRAERRGESEIVLRKKR